MSGYEGSLPLTKYRQRLVALASLAAVICIEATAANVRVLHRTGTDDPATLDPHRISFPGEQLVTLDLFESLTVLDPQGRPIGGAAESWTTSADGRTWVFRLRKGLTWSDGRALAASDFVYSFRRMLAPATAYPYAARLFPIRNARRVNRGELEPAQLGVSAPDALTVRFDLEHPAVYWLDVLATSAPPVPPHRVEALGGEWIQPRNFVGNGAFVLERWVPNGFVRLRKNPRFHAARDVRLDAVVHYPVSQPMTAVRRFRAGQLDFILVAPPEQSETLARELGPGFKILRGISIETLAFNSRRGATADVRVRRALSLAIDREAIARGIVGFPGAEAYGFVPPGVMNYSDGARADFATWPRVRRVAEARRLLAQAGFGPAKPLRPRLSFPATELNRKVATAIAAMWKGVGVIAEMQQKEMKSLVADVGRGDFDATRFIWNAGYDDPLAFLERMSGGADAGSMNQSGYDNPRFDRLLQAAQQEPDAAKRAAVLRRAEALALADHPVAPLYYLVGRRLVAARVSGFVPNPRGIHLSRWLSVTPREE